MYLQLIDWAFWMPDCSTAAAVRTWRAAGRPTLSEGIVPDVSFLPPLVRRRLSRHVKMALHVAHAALRGRAPDACRSVFASRHGEVGRTVGLLAQIVEREALSPTDFAMSVHNTASGQFSIWAANRHPTTALAAGRETVAAALLDAAGNLARDPATPVLLVLSDEALPSVFAPYADEPPLSAAVALLLASDCTSSTTHALLTNSETSIRRLSLELVDAHAHAPDAARSGTALRDLAAASQLLQLIEWLVDAASETNPAMTTISDSTSFTTDRPPTPPLALSMQGLVVTLAAHAPHAESDTPLAVTQPAGRQQVASHAHRHCAREGTP